MSAETPVPRDEFIARFKAELLRLIGPQFADGYSVADYADDAAPSYWEEHSQRGDGPEECAFSDFGEME